MQAETGTGAGPTRKGLVENLVEKAIEILPHQITGADPVPAPTATSAGHPYASEGNTAVGPLSTLAYLYCREFFVLHGVLLHICCSCDCMQHTGTCMQSFISVVSRHIETRDCILHLCCQTCCLWHHWGRWYTCVCSV